MNAHVRSSLMQAVQRMNGSPVAVRESDTNFLLNIQSVFQMSADEDDFDLDAEERIAAERNRNLCAAYGMAPSSGNKPFAFSGGFCGSCGATGRSSSWLFAASICSPLLAIAAIL